jgi:flagellin-like hook-associated protein FlgL
MSQTTRFNGNYVFQGVDTTSNVVVNTHSLVVTGNLAVTGTTTSVNSTNTSITDNIVTLNKGETGAGVTAVYSGIEIDRGISPKTSIRWNESTVRWELTSDGSTFVPITTGSSATPLVHVMDDTAPQLGGNLDVLARTIFSSNVEIVKFDDNVAIKNSTVAPSYYSGYNVVYAQTPGSGGSGLYVTNSTYQQQELATKAKAITYSIIFG